MIPRCLLLLPALLGAFAAPVLGAIERLPIAEFARQPEMMRVALSPDGRRIAFLREFNSLPVLHVLDLDTDKTARIDIGDASWANGAPREVRAFTWLNDRRLLVTATVWDDSMFTIIAVDAAGGPFVPIAGGDSLVPGVFSHAFRSEVLHRFDDKEGTILMPGRVSGQNFATNNLDVLHVNTTTGHSRVAVKNPGEVAAWGVDGAGHVRAGLLSHGDLKGVVYREDEKAKWRTVLPLAARDDMRPLGFDAANDGILMIASTPAQRWAIFRLDPKSGEMGEPLIADDVYDIIPDRAVPSVDGAPLSAPIFSPRRDALLGVRYVTDAPRVRWFDAKFAGYQKAMDRTRADLINLMIGASRDMTRLLWFGFSDRNPGEYFILDTEKRSIAPIGGRMPWVKPAAMAPMHAITYQARDGTRIHGYLTVPTGHAPKGLPLVVMPHGGPWVRDVWGFEPFVQALANRGYGVLQMNYRGSPGYGIESFRAARRQIGKAIQDDIEDATRWAIDAGVADAQRIAIVGASYGGYSTLFGLAKSPGLYRCGVAIAAVTDWPEIFDERKGDPQFANATRYWRREIGDPRTDAEFLRSISPIHFASEITSPLCLIHGVEDKIVPVAQAKAMVQALESAGRPPRVVYVKDAGHALSNEAIRLEVFETTVRFLEEHLGAGLE
ncbi:MAG: S9 family peptidase [Opitutaceae bacterium]|nr:S9 family peptidase [Opitutaceae bacterium]